MVLAMMLRTTTMTMMIAESVGPLPRRWLTQRTCKLILRPAPEQAERAEMVT